MSVRSRPVLLLVLPLALLVGCAGGPAPEVPTAAPEPVASAPANAPEPAAQPLPPSVEEVQRLLDARGYRPGAIDGQMGPRTTNALRRFQRDQRLPMSGLLDAATVEALTR